MTNVELQTHEEQSVLLPTTLNLLRLKEPERNKLQSKLESTQQLTNNSIIALESLGRFVATVFRTGTRLVETRGEVEDLIANLESSAACSLVFLKMREELPNLSSEEVLDIFTRCIYINVEILHLFGQNNSNRTKTRQSLFLETVSMLNSRNKIKTETDEINVRIAGDPPKWFDGSTQSWHHFVFSHADFVKILNPNLKRTRGNMMKLIENSDHALGFLRLDEYPDWLENKEPPTDDAVQQELDEDTNGITKATQKIEAIGRQENYVFENLSQKMDKTTTWLETQMQKLFPSEPKNVFWDQILMLNVEDTILKHSYEERKHLPLPEERYIDTIIKEFTDGSDPAANPEPVALFLETTMRKSGIIKDAKTPVNDTIVELFNTLIDSMRTEGKEDPSFIKFQDLKNINHKVFKALNYSIKPLLAIMTSDEINYLRELLGVSKGDPIESFIWEIAELTSSHFKREQNAESEETKQLKDIAANLIRKPMAAFLRNYWRWTYEQLERSLTGLSTSFVSLPSSQAVDLLKPSDPLTPPEVQEIQSSIKELNQGNLGGWQIFYTDNKSLDERHLTKVGGETLEEREEALQKLLLREWHSPSIKCGSIIRAFDWLVTVPEAAEQMRGKKDVAGETFGKLKRQAIRIFYNMDRQKKKIIFFLHQKQAWSYGF